MLFVYKPEGREDDPMKWEFATNKLMNVEAEAIERATKMTYGEWADAVTRGSMTALHGLLWVMLKRGNPTLTYDECPGFNLSEVDFELDDEESAEALAELEAKAAGGELNAAEKSMLASLRETAPAATVESADEVPKELPALVS